jgi:hypothetical protein
MRRIPVFCQQCGIRTTATVMHLSSRMRRSVSLVAGARALQVRSEDSIARQNYLVHTLGRTRLTVAQ